MKFQCFIQEEINLFNRCHFLSVVSFCYVIYTFCLKHNNTINVQYIEEVEILKYRKYNVFIN